MGLYLRPRIIAPNAVIEGTYGGNHVYLFGRYWQVGGYYHFHWLGKRRRFKRGRLVGGLHALKHRLKRSKDNVSIADLITPDGRRTFIYTDKGVVPIRLREGNC